MPTTPNFSIDYPCEGTSVSLADFQMLAMDTEAALVTVDAAATFATHRPYAAGNWSLANPAVGVETTSIFSASSLSTTGMTVNAAAGTVTIIRPGIHHVSVTCFNPQSSLTLTSQRASVFKNAVYQLGKRFRGSNPTDIFVNGGSYSAALSFAAGDVITISYLWTGTGSLAAAGGAGGRFDVSFLYAA